MTCWGRRPCGDGEEPPSATRVEHANGPVLGGGHPDALPVRAERQVMRDEAGVEAAEQAWARGPRDIHDRDLTRLLAERDPEPVAIRRDGEVVRSDPDIEPFDDAFPRQGDDVELPTRVVRYVGPFSAGGERGEVRRAESAQDLRHSQRACAEERNRSRARADHHDDLLVGHDVLWIGGQRHAPQHLPVGKGDRDQLVLRLRGDERDRSSARGPRDRARRRQHERGERESGEGSPSHRPSYGRDGRASPSGRRRDGAGRRIGVADRDRLRMR